MRSSLSAGGGDLLPDHFLRHRERVLPLHAQKTSVGRDLKDLFTNRPWLVLLAATVTFILVSSPPVHDHGPLSQILRGRPAGDTAMEQRPRTYVYEDIISVFGRWVDAGSILECCLWGVCRHKVGKKPAFLISSSACRCAHPGILLGENPTSCPGLRAQFLVRHGGPPQCSALGDVRGHADYGNGRKAAGPGLGLLARRCSQKAGWRSAEWWSNTCWMPTRLHSNVAHLPGYWTDWSGS